MGAGQTAEATLKDDLHPKKIMVRVRWRGKEIIHWELLLTGCTITADLYCQRLDQIAAEFQGKLSGVYILHDNTRLYVTKSTYDKLLAFRLITVPYPLYSLDLAATD